MTWENPGEGQQPKWDQTKQSIEIHETDIYPDLKYTSAYAAPLYVKYTSGSLLNELLVEINRVIDSKISQEKKNEAELPAGPDRKALPAANKPKELPSGPDRKALPAANKPKELPGGAETAQALLMAPVRGSDTVNQESPNLPAKIDNNEPNSSEPEVMSNDAVEKEGAKKAYTVTVYGDRLRFLEGQQERGAYSAGVKFLYKVSNNLTKTVAEDSIDNKSKIWAEVKFGGLLGGSIKLQFSEFDETEFKFGGNLLAQVLPSVELSFTPDQDSVYSKEKPELDIADVIKATNITLGSKTTTEIKALQKQIQKEIESRESQPQDDSGKQSDSDKNK
jgi:hypothetical protein